MTEIVLIRHGETAWNAERRLQGHLDIGLNEQGLRQAEALGAALALEKFDAVYVSDLQRALQTARAVAQHHDLPLQVDAGLRERCFGAFEGLLYADLCNCHPAAYASWIAREPDVRYPPGENIAETLNEFYARSIAAFERIVQSGRHDKIAIVSHGGVLDCIYRAAHKMPITVERDFDVFNASINRMRWVDGEFQLQEWGNVAHLTAETLDELEP
jgi:probable phosphoglycerate mutase